MTAGVVGIQQHQPAVPGDGISAVTGAQGRPVSVTVSVLATKPTRTGFFNVDMQMHHRTKDADLDADVVHLHESSNSKHAHGKNKHFLFMQEMAFPLTKYIIVW